MTLRARNRDCVDRASHFYVFSCAKNEEHELCWAQKSRLTYGFPRLKLGEAENWKKKSMKLDVDIRIYYSSI